MRQDAIKGAYEIAVHPASGSVFVASTPSFEPAYPGYVHRLDARTLQVQQAIQLPRRAFALGLNRATGTLYVGNTLDGSLTAVDAASGFVKGVFQLAQPEKGEDGKESVAHTRKVLVDEKHDRVFVTSPGRAGKVWIVDGATGQVRHTVETGEPWTAGVAYDEAANRLYVSQGGIDEILAIDPDTGAIVQRLSTGDSKDRQKPEHFFINLAIDAQGGRLFAIDASTNQVYVVNVADGSVVRQVPVGGIGALDIAYNPQRNEFYTTHRGVSRERPEGTGAVTVFDASTYAVKRVIDLPAHPNSLALTPDGTTLYVTVKAPHGEKHPAFRKDALDGVVRIDL
ncbi:YncE family protein [Verticiella sediminum]